MPYLDGTRTSTLAMDHTQDVTVTIVNALVGDFEFNSPETLSAFALGLVLFIITLILNMISLSLIRKFKEKYKVNTL